MRNFDEALRDENKGFNFHRKFVEQVEVEPVSDIL